jgi:hypothetical protein
MHSVGVADSGLLQDALHLSQIALRSCFGENSLNVRRAARSSGLFDSEFRCFALAYF